MFDEMSLLGWISMGIVFAAGGGAGFFIARQIKDKRTLQLEQQLEATQQQLTDYRQDVNRHFLKTSLLVSKLTDNYREVYEHLATGAQKLCTEQPRTPELKLPDSNILPTAIPAEISDDSQATAAVENRLAEQTGAIPQSATRSTEHDTEHATEQSEEETVSEAGHEAMPISEKEAQAASALTSEESEDEIALGAESTPGVEPELHKTHPAIH
jgi:uncharacterized membrane-anchored protein YhcB (DUF1043 family)